MRESVRDRLTKATESQTNNRNDFGALNRTVGYKSDAQKLADRNRQRNPAILARLLEAHRLGDVCRAGTCKICFGQHKRRFYG